jgi:hypothetical protein
MNGQRIFLYLTLGLLMLLGAGALAQTEPAATEDVTDAAIPLCEPGESDDPEGAETEGAPDEDQECLPPDPEEEIVEATPDQVFQPGSEISEDYPVPLPADI